MRILDSDHWVALLRGRLDLRGHVTPDEELAMTAVSLAELAHGAHKSAHRAENLARLDVLVAAVPVLPFDEGAAHRFGQLKAELEQAGARVSDLDLQIASIALHHGAALVSHNRRHFQRIVGLTVEDWLAA
jgi:tRNA(fMet)-specific endonuclease VapC